MSWEKFSHNSTDCFTGDLPWDEFESSLSRIAIDYQERFGRKPKIIELVTALQTVLKSKHVFDLDENERVLLDYTIINLQENYLNEATPSTEKIDLEAIYDFEGAYTDLTEPGYYLIVRKSNINSSPEEDCIKISVLEVEDNVLICDFEILTQDIDDTDAYKFIRKYLLKEFCSDYFRHEASTIQFKNIKSGTIQHFQML